MITAESEFTHQSHRGSPDLGTPKFYGIEKWTQILGRQPRLLVVEDDREILAALLEWFDFDGWQVRGVDDGSAFYAMLEPVLAGEAPSEYFDVIISDIAMPGIDVIAILDGLRAIGCPVPLAVISALPDPKLPERVTAWGRAEFFAKPFSIDALHVAVRALLLATARTEH